MDDIEFIYVRFLEHSVDGDVITSFGWTTEEELAKPLAKVLREELASLTLIYRNTEYLRIMDKNKAMKAKLKQSIDWARFL